MGFSPVQGSSRGAHTLLPTAKASAVPTLELTDVAASAAEKVSRRIVEPLVSATGPGQISSAAGKITTRASTLLGASTRRKAKTRTAGTAFALKKESVGTTG